MKRPPGKEMLTRARSLRRDATEAEKHLWKHLRSGQLGVKFRRQMWLAGSIADFASVEARLVIELDGGQHADSESDARRTERLTAEGYRVLRFWNNDVLENVEGVLRVISGALPSPSHAASQRGPLPLPNMGEGLTR